MNRLGKVSFILSLICLLLTFAFKLALKGSIPFIGYGLFFGAFFFIFGVAINFRYFKAALHSESLHFLLKSTVAILLSCLLGFFVNYIVLKNNWVQDVTENKIHSLSNLTQALVKALPEELNFYYFHVGNAKVRGFEAQVRSELNRYVELSSKVHFQSYSVFKRPDLAKKFKVADEESSLYAEYQGRIQRVSDLQENAITNAILKLTKDPKKIYFVNSHDERRINDESTFGLKGLKEQLERLHYKTDSLKDFSKIPEDVAMLVMVGPRKALTEQEIRQLDQYLQKGGSLFVALDPGEEHNMSALLEKYGIAVNSNFMFSDQAQAGQSELLVLTYKGSSKHEVAQSLQPGQNPALFISSSIDILSESPSQAKVEPVLEHLPNSLGKKDIDPKSPVVSQGEQYAAVVSEGVGEKYFRIAVVGDSDFLTNQFYLRPGNFDFALGLFTFLSKDEDLLKMRPTLAKTTYLILTQTQMNLYFLFFVLPFIILFFIAALFFKLRRFF